MSEPVMGVGIGRPPALRRFAMLATALSLLATAVLSAPVLAAATPAVETVYSIESAKAAKAPACAMRPMPKWLRTLSKARISGAAPKA